MRREFSIEKAKAGAKVVTRNGKPVEILKYNYKVDGNQLLVVCRKENVDNDYVYTVHTNGVWVRGEENNSDLFIEVESEFRPYTNAEELDAAIIKHGCVVRAKNSKDRRSIRSYKEGYVELGGVRATHTYKCLLKMYTWLDGTPCGVQEGGEE